MIIDVQNNDKKNRMVLLKFGILLFIVYLISWVVQFSVFMIQPERTIFQHLFVVSNFLLFFNILFMGIEILLYLTSLSEQYRDYHRPNKLADQS